MAIQVSGTQVIGNSRELTNIASIDATTAAAIGAAGVGGGGTVDLTADGSISSGDVVGISGSGTVATTAALFGPKTSFTTANRDYPVSYWDQSANKVVVLSSSGNNLYVRVGTIASNGTITWGTEASYNHGGSATNMSVAMHNNVIVGTFSLSNYGSYLMMQSFGVSGTTVSSSSSLSYLDGSQNYYGGSNNVQSLMADPNNSGKFVQVYTGGGASDPRAAAITATGSSISVSTVLVSSAAGPSYFFQGLAYNPTSGKFMGTWVENGNIVTACRLQISGSSISVGTPIITDLSQSNDQSSMAYSSSNGNFLYFVRDGGKLYGWVINTDSNGNATSFGGANLIYTGSGSDYQVRYTYNSSNSTTVGAWKMGDGGSNFLILSDTAAGVITVDGDPIDISDTASTSMNYGGPWGMQGKGSFVSYNANTSPWDSSELNTASTYFTAIGISEGNYTNGQTATITILGGVTSTISGLTPGAYYTPSSSTVGGLEGGGSFGQALATNKLLLK